MAGSSAGWHESYELLQPKTRDMHRAVISLIEELEALDWYAQRIDASADAPLRDILRHNGDEEKEHAAMLLEWIRRHDPVFDRHLRTYLFRDGAIVGIEQQAEAAAEAGAPRPAARPTVGSLKEDASS